MEVRKRRRQREIPRTVSLTQAPAGKGQVSDQNWKGEQEKREASQGKKEAWLWVEPLETLPVCKKDKIKSAGQLQMLQERRKTGKKYSHSKGRTYCFTWGSTLISSKRNTTLLNMQKGHWLSPRISATQWALQQKQKDPGRATALSLLVIHKKHLKGSKQ